jgi:predicted dehydrogenase
MYTPINRRQFIGQTTVGAVMAGAYIRTAAAAESKSPNEKLNIACVGCGGRGASDVNGVGSQNIVALCDIDDKRAAGIYKKFPKATKYKDFRKMIEKEAKNFEAIVVGTPDHLHAPISAMAMAMGKHAYCEKPLAHSVHESRVLAKLAEDNKLVTQMGTQIHAGENYRRVVELIQGGAIGNVTDCHVWCGKSWSGGRYKPGTPPAGFDWDLYLGPRPKIPYSTGVHPGNWRRFWHFGTGTLGDMACHYMDLAHWALKLMYPTSVASEGPEVHEVGTPKWMIVRYEHPQRGDMPPCKVTWYDGGKKPEILKILKRKDGKPVKWGDGQLFIGDKGMLLSNYGKHLLLPEEKYIDFKYPEKSIAKSIGHHNEWIKACKTGGPTTCNFKYSGALSESVLLGNVAFRVGKKLDWDAKNVRATNAPEADKFIRNTYREGWDFITKA